MVEERPGHDPMKNVRDGFDAFCRRYGLKDLGDVDDEGGFFLVRAAEIPSEIHPTIRLTVAPEDYKVIIDIAADNGNHFMPYRELSSFEYGQSGTQTLRRRIALRLRVALLAAQSLTEVNLTEQRPHH